MIKHTKHLTLAAMSVLLSGCNECENGFKVRTEHKTIFFSESWHENPKDTFLDGAIRVTTSTYKEARAVTVRCFKASNSNVKPVYDLRYTISIPLLKRIGPELEKAGAAEIVVAVDGTSIGAFKARPLSHNDGVSFLADVPQEVIDKLATAQKAIVVMPRQRDEKLDEVLEFGVAKLADHIKPVIAACAPTTLAPPAAPKQQTTKA